MLWTHVIDKWKWIGYKFKYHEKWDAYLIIQVYPNQK